MTGVKLLFLAWQNCRVCINADDIKKSNLCCDLEAAQKAEQLSQSMLDNGENFL